jgi:hypothetical protein
MHNFYVGALDTKEAVSLGVPINRLGHHGNPELTDCKLREILPRAKPKASHHKPLFNVFEHHFPVKSIPILFGTVPGIGKEQLH